MKTGTTSGAGPCVTINYVNFKKDIDVLIILLNSYDEKERWADVIKLRDFVIDKIENGGLIEWCILNLTFIIIFFAIHNEYIVLYIVLYNIIA